MLDMYSFWVGVGSTFLFMVLALSVAVLAGRFCAGSGKPRD